MATLTIPTILTASTYFWTPSASANGRRASEDKKLTEVADFLKALGFEVEQNAERVFATLGEIEVTFFYSESCKNVYKNLTIYKGGKKSNISAIKKLL